MLLVMKIDYALNSAARTLFSNVNSKIPGFTLIFLVSFPRNYYFSIDTMDIIKTYANLISNLTALKKFQKIQIFLSGI